MSRSENNILAPVLRKLQHWRPLDSKDQEAMLALPARAERAAVGQALAALTQQAVDGQGPLVSPRGRVLDHIAFSVPDVPATLDRLRAAGVKVLQDAIALVDIRADAPMAA